MKLRGHMFSGSSDLFATHEHIKSIAGHATWLSEFIPKHCPERYAVEELLKELQKCDVCCTVIEGFPAYIAGRFDHYETATIFIADDGSNNAHCLPLLLQRGETFGTFTIGALKFTRLSSFAFSILDYRMTYGDVALTIEVIPVDTMKKCGAISNLDFVKLIWDHNTFCFLKYAMCMMPTTSPYVVFLRHYRAESDGWLNRARCDDCLAIPKQLLAERVGCKVPNNCTCSVCIKQPPTLNAATSHVVFTMVFNLDKFQITADTLYQNLDYTKTLPADRLVKFDVSQVTARYLQFDNIPKRYFHTECAPTGRQNGRRWTC